MYSILKKIKMITICLSLLLYSGSVNSEVVTTLSASGSAKIIAVSLPASGPVLIVAAIVVAVAGFLSYKSRKKRREAKERRKRYQEWAVRVINHSLDRVNKVNAFFAESATAECKILRGALSIVVADVLSSYDEAQSCSPAKEVGKKIECRDTIIGLKSVISSLQSQFTRYDSNLYHKCIATGANLKAEIETISKDMKFAPPITEEYFSTLKIEEHLDIIKEGRRFIDVIDKGLKIPQGLKAEFIESELAKSKIEYEKKRRCRKKENEISRIAENAYFDFLIHYKIGNITTGLRMKRLLEEISHAEEVGVSECDSDAKNKTLLKEKLSEIDDWLSKKTEREMVLDACEWIRYDNDEECLERHGDPSFRALINARVVRKLGGANYVY